LISLASDHAVLPLLAARLAATGQVDRLSKTISAELRAQTSVAVALALAVGPEVRRLLEECSRRGAVIQLLKGAALAYTHYPAPHLRPRADTDLLVHRGDRDTVVAALEALGYERMVVVSGELIVHQMQFEQRIAGGVVHQIDLHWKLLNPVAFADRLTVEELMAARVPVPAMGPDAWALHPVHLLLHLAMHRIAHHEPAPDLRWLYDIHLVASSLAGDDWQRLESLAESRELGEITARALTAAASVFGMGLPPAAARWARDAAVRPLPRAFQPFMTPDRRVVTVIAADVRAARSWRAAIRVLREHVLPPAAYMRARYGIARSWLLPYYYAHRAIAGAPRIFRRGR
jgi:hypothetical protein